MRLAILIGIGLPALVGVVGFWWSVFAFVVGL